MPTITQTAYGTYAHGIPFSRCESGYGAAWYRMDTYHTTTAPDLDGQTDRFACVSSTDDSPPYPGPYASQCPCCWLGHSHTTAYHTAHSTHAR